MPSPSGSATRIAFARAVDALCLSRAEIARVLGVSATLLDAYTDGTQPVPPMTRLELVDLLKSHEAQLGAAAGSLYEESMYRLEQSSSEDAALLGDPRALPPPSGGRREPS